MDWFPKSVYADVRTEEKNSTVMVFHKKNLDTLRIRKDRGGYLRIFDGKRWFTHATTSINKVKDQLSDLAKLAVPDPTIEQHPRIKMMSKVTQSSLHFQKNNILQPSVEEKKEVLFQFQNLLEKEPLLTDWSLYYNDFHLIKQFQSSIGADITYDNQLIGIGVLIQMKHEGRFFQEMYQKASLHLENLLHLQEDFQVLLEKAKQSLIDGKHVEAGTHTVILSPFAAGIFAHESFGHKSEADFMTMSSSSDLQEEWPLGKKVGSDQLSIIDDGSLPGGGFVPFDDEGTPAHQTWLVRNGILSGRLHSVETALEMGEKPTGNARAVNYEFDPIVRMTNTMIEPGNISQEQLFESVDHGYYIETIKHGSGMSRFTIAPSIAYEIHHGKITQPVEIGVLSGNVMETLYKISALSDKKELFSLALGGCGKFEQTGLPVGFGGPYMRIDRMEIQ